jgi:hypothetical protein
MKVVAKNMMIHTSAVLAIEHIKEVQSDEGADDTLSPARLSSPSVVTAGKGSGYVITIDRHCAAVWSPITLAVLSVVQFPKVRRRHVALCVSSSHSHPAPLSLSLSLPPSPPPPPPLSLSLSLSLSLCLSLPCSL